MSHDVELADQLGRQLFRLIRTVERTKAQSAASRGDGMEKACVGLLVELVDHGPRRATALAEAVYADPSTVSRQVAQLVALELVERQPDPGDGRASQLAATELGKAHVTDIRTRRNEHLAAMLGNWSESDRHDLVRLLSRLNDDFETYRPQMLGSEHPRALRENA